MENEGNVNTSINASTTKSRVQMNTPSNKKPRKTFVRSYNRLSKSIILTDRKERVDDYQQHQALRCNGRKASYKILAKASVPVQNAEDSEQQINITEDLKQLEHLMKELQKQCELQYLEIKECELSKKMTVQSFQMKKQILKGQRKYFQQLQEFNEKYSTLRQRNEQLKIQHDIHVYKQQNQIYLMTIQLEKVRQQIKGFQSQLARQKIKRNQQMLQLQYALNNRKEAQNLAKKAQEDLAQQKSALQQINQALEKQKFLTFVLKTQLSPKIRTGFHITTKDFDHQQCLHKKLVAWDTKKQPSKNLSNDHVFYWMVLQLYKSWRKILKSVPYSNNIYRSLLGLQKGNIDYVMKLLQKVNIQRQSTKMIKRQIIVGSPKYDFYGEIKQFLLKKIGSFQNEYLKVTQINLTNEENCQVLEVRYTLLQQKKVQIFEFYRIKDFTKEQIQRFIIPKQQKTVCSIVDIPAFIQQDDFTKYKTLYDYFKILG